MPRAMKRAFAATCVALGLFLPLSVAAAQQGRQSEPPKLPEGVTVHRDMAYVTKGHERQKLDLYLPKDGANLPLIITIHGGAFKGPAQE